MQSSFVLCFCLFEKDILEFFQPSGKQTNFFITTQFQIRSKENNLFCFSPFFPVNSNMGLVVFRVYSMIPRDVWFNIGISLSNFIDPTASVYFNGISMPVEQVMPPTETPLKRTDRCLNGLILGSSKIEQSAAGIAYNDFILWYRWLYSFESHLFVGYTSKLNNTVSVKLV